MKTQMTMEPKPRIAHIVQIGILQRRLDMVTSLPGRKVIHAKIAHLSDALGRWVEDGQIVPQQIRDGFAAEGVDSSALSARLAGLLKDEKRKRPASAAGGKRRPGMPL